MTRLISIFFILIIIIQCRHHTTRRKSFSIIVIDTVIQVGGDGKKGSFTLEYLRGKYQHRKYIVNQDTIKVYGFGDKQPLTQIYIDTLSYSDYINLYNYLREKKLDTLAGEYSSDLDHGMITSITISGDSIPNVKIVDNCAFEPSVENILIHVDKLIKNKETRMYND